jgi:hypothetical protein
MASPTRIRVRPSWWARDVRIGGWSAIAVRTGSVGGGNDG